MFVEGNISSKISTWCDVVLSMYLSSDSKSSIYDVDRVDEDTPLSYQYLATSLHALSSRLQYRLSYMVDKVVSHFRALAPPLSTISYCTLMHETMLSCKR